MGRDSHTNNGRTSAVVRRVLWALMAAMHVPALLTAWAGWAAEGFGAVRLGVCVALTLAMAFFGLKVYGPAWLAFKTDVRSWAAAGLIIAFIHFNALSQDSPLSYVTEASTVSATGAFVLVGFVLPKAAWRGARFVDAFNIRPSVTRTGDTLWFDDSRPHCWTLASRIFRAHAPPV